MVYFLLTIILILAGIIFYQYKAKINRNRQLSYIQQKLTTIITNNTRENLLVFTDDKQLISLLTSINGLLNANQKILADYITNQESTKKMISNISHDLKTPLTVITGYLEMVALNKAIPIDEERKISKAYEKAEELQTLITKFFDLTKIESGDKQASLEKVNLNEVCKKCMLGFYEILTDNELEISINIPNKNLYAIGNEEILTRILNNLISNAIKYGSEGNIIGLNLTTDDQFIYIEIWDKGKGIQEKEQEKIFERLYTLEDSRNKMYQGSGLGLTITKRLVESIDGKIQLTSEPYDKTTFTIQLKKLTA
ncbi:sensor histidine kinase [Tetragenococcus koreensis]|nr:sensor histidine kinase [Tetragenococcus koreensis]AYW45279.1 sensor histidine kinase [Tetragenococcus koreensis]MCF1619486.1 sensor histidine kinase [Tetragenococcus koreensis]MCF1656968.1 sensor histidine kinase [Tetragenococcus koreensis]GEN90294.1 two-component sensor histidine kinase [Tetragenococcus koreensis]